MRPHSTISERFWSKVDRTGDCWLWQGCRRPDGYGQVTITGHKHSAHRVAYALTSGPIPGGLQVLHRCDTPLCCNPSHLFLGTNTDNMRDKTTKGRNVSKQGEAVFNHKLNTEQVRTIRARYAAGGISKKALGRMFDINEMTIARIIDGRAWKHVT